MDSASFAIANGKSQSLRLLDAHSQSDHHGDSTTPSPGRKYHQRSKSATRNGDLALATTDDGSAERPRPSPLTGAPIERRPVGATQRTCGKCNGALTGQFVRALENTYHLECFTCNVRSPSSFITFYMDTY